MTKTFEPSPQGQEEVEQQAQQQEPAGEPGEEQIVNDVFGEGETREIFGPDQTAQEDPQAQQQAGEPAQQDPQGQEQQEGQGQPEEPQGEKILGKFNSQQDLARGLKEIESKLPKNFDWAKINSKDDMKAAYQQAQQELGATSDPKLAELRNQNAMLQQQLQQMMGQQPRQGQPAPQQAQQGQAIPQNQPQEVENDGFDIDNDQFLDEFYDNPGQTIQQTVEKLVDKKVEERENQRSKQQQQQMQQKQQIEKRIQGQVNQIKLANPQEFEQHRDQMEKIVRENPVYSMVPNGMQLAFNEAKLTNQNSGEPQPQPQNQRQLAQNNNARKQVARMARNNNRTIKGKQSYEEQVTDNIFGEGNNGGVFG